MLYSLVLLIFIPYAIIVIFLIKHSSKLGQFGDAFGVINALFTGLAFAGVAYSLYMQQDENKKRDADSKEQRERARDEYEQLVRSNTVLADELKTMQATAKLSVLPALIKSEELHLTTHHKDFIHGAPIETWAIEKLVEALENAEDSLDRLKRFEGGDSAAIPSTHWLIMPQNRPPAEYYAGFVERLRQLCQYRKDLVDTYKSLKT